MRASLTVLGCALLAGCRIALPPTAIDLPQGAERSAPTTQTTDRDLQAATQATQPDPTSPARPSATSTAAESTELGPTEAPGELLFTRYPGLIDDDEVPLIVYLPPGYAWRPGPFPAVYLLHGIGYDENQWVDLGLPQLLDDQIGRGAWEPMLLVMPLAPERLFRRTDGGPGSYEDELVNGLKPYIERNFRGDPARSALAGISRGGVWALEIAFRNPAAFTGVAALSPALNVNRPRQTYDPFWIVTQESNYPSAIYLDAGLREPRIVEVVQHFSGLLDQLGVPHRLNLGDGGHNQDYWSEVAPAALTALVRGFQPAQLAPPVP